MSRRKIFLIPCVFLVCCTSPESVQPASSAAKKAEASVTSDEVPAEVAGGIVPDESQPQEPVKVGGDVKAPVVIKRVEPDIKYDPEKQYYQSVLILEAVIDESGQVRDVRALNYQDGPFTAAYVEALKEWEFQPGTLHGKPVPVIFNLTAHHFPVKEAP